MYSINGTHVRSVSWKRTVSAAMRGVMPGRLYALRLNATYCRLCSTAGIRQRGALSKEVCHVGKFGQYAPYRD